MTQDSEPHFMLGVISGKIDLILLNQAENEKRTEARFVKIEERQDRADARLDKAEAETVGLKRDRAWVIGLSGLLSVVGGGLAAFFKGAAG